jgi:hypothetical protein
VKKWWKDCLARCSRRVHKLEEGKIAMLMFERVFDCAKEFVFEWSTLCI